MNFRKVLPNDKQELINLFELVLRQTFKQNEIDDKIALKSEIDEKKEFLAYYYKDNNDEYPFFVITYKRRIIACVCILNSNDIINKITNNKLKNMFEVSTFFVHPDYQNKGVSKFIWKKVIDYLKKEKITCVCFDSGYKIAQKIWQKQFGKPKYCAINFWAENNHHMIWVIKISKS